MSAPTNQTILDNIKTAINNVMSGGAVQSYSVGGRNLQRCSLNDLMELQKYYTRLVAAENSGDTRTYAEPVDPS